MIGNIKYVLSTAFITLFLGVFVVRAYSVSPQTQSALVQAVQNKNSRAPASVSNASIKMESNTDHVDESLARSQTVELGCEDVSDLKVHGTHVRLRSLKCAETLTSVVNKTNGYTASVVNHKELSTTDFIDLQSGENVLEVERVDSSGKKVIHTVKVSRTLPSRIPASE